MLRNLWEKIANIGVYAKQPHFEKMASWIINKMNLAVLVNLIVLISMGIVYHIYWYALLCSAGVGVVFLVFILQHNRLYRLAQVSLLLFLTIGNSIISILIGNDAGTDTYFIILAVLAFIVFGYSVLGYVFFMLNLVGFSIVTYYQFHYQPFWTEAIFSHVYFAYLNYAIMFFFLLVMMRNFTKSSLEYTAYIRRHNTQLKEYQAEVVHQNVQLEEQMQEIDILNRKINHKLDALNASMIVSYTDTKGIIKYANDKFCEVSKYTREELIGKNHNIVNSGYHNTAFWRNMWQTISVGKIWRGEVRNKAKDGSYYWVDTVVAPMLDEHGKPLEYLSIRMDITDRKDLEQNYQDISEILATKIQELEQSKELIEDHLEQTFASIRYASRIQQAILSDEAHELQQFRESFVFYQPRNIVSGDFYWFSNQGRYKVVIAGDCTGHGTPAAFLTILGTAFLNEIVNEYHIIEPDKILYALDSKVKKALASRNTTDSIINDGMDIAVLVFDQTHLNVYFSSARSQVYMVRDTHMQVLKGSIYPIGASIQYTEPKVFETQPLTIQKNDVFYLFSDGYQDQFGELNNKKFSKKRFRELLETISPLDMNHQKEVLKNTFNGWKGKEQQTDDIMVIGIRL